jgi:hypothetical protein
MHFVFVTQLIFFFEDQDIIITLENQDIIEVTLNKKN